MLNFDSIYISTIEFLFFSEHKILSIEDAILDSGNIILKTTYSEIQSLSYYFQGYSVIKEGNFTFFNIKFQLEGNTALHLFALDEDVLKLILEYYLKNKQEYLWSIVMKNFEGKTPLDITIEYDSPRCTNLLLTYLWNLRDGNFSRQIYHIFPTLLERGLKSFHDFLDTCLYQTVQMKNIKYLSLKDNDDIQNNIKKAIVYLNDKKNVIRKFVFILNKIINTNRIYFIYCLLNIKFYILAFYIKIITKICFMVIDSMQECKIFLIFWKNKNFIRFKISSKKELLCQIIKNIYDSPLQLFAW